MIDEQSAARTTVFTRTSIFSVIMCLVLPLVLAFLLTPTALALPLIRSTPVLPSKDSFYTVPRDIDQYQPGSILTYRKPPYPIAALGIAKANIKESHQILYRTTDSHGNATATVLTVLIPNNADYTKVLSYQVAEDAGSINCAPSYALQLGSARGELLGTIVTQAEVLLIESALEQGWVVIVPDFQGPGGAFLANRLAGQAILDGIRAALQSSEFTGISQQPTIALWGYSGGGITSAWAAELQPSYAPELDIAGAALGGIEPTLPKVLSNINRSFFSGLIASGIVGLSNEYPSVARSMGENLKPEHTKTLEKMKQQCAVANILEFSGQDILSMFNEGTFSLPENVKIMEANALGQAVPKTPLFIYKSVFDEVSAVQETDDLYDFYCSQGASVEYERDLLSEHAILAITGAPRALSFLNNVMAGRQPRRGCYKNTVTSSLLDPDVKKLLPSVLLNAFLDLLGKPIGPAFFG